nr:transcription initiation factor iia subunit 2 [Quercus suber]
MAATPLTYYELYRGTSIGLALADTLDDLISTRRIEPQLAMRIMQNFDQNIAAVLGDKVKARLSFKGHLDTYRFCDEVWTFIIKDVKIKLDNQQPLEAERVKIVACQSKEKPQNSQSARGHAELRRTGGLSNTTSKVMSFDNLFKPEIDPSSPLSTRCSIRSSTSHCAPRSEWHPDHPSSPSARRIPLIKQIIIADLLRCVIARLRTWTHFSPWRSQAPDTRYVHRPA